MKEIFSAEQRTAIINYRLERAYLALDEAKYLYKGGCYNTSVSQLYYVCYFAAKALLFSRNIDVYLHKEVRMSFMTHFIKSGLLNIELGVLYDMLFDKWNYLDFNDFVYCDASTIEVLRPRAEAFIAAVEKLTRNVPTE